MAKPKLPPTITSTFALVEIKTGRKAIAKLAEASYKIPFTITGYIHPGAGGVGNDDGVGIEFSSEVETLKLGEPVLAPTDKLGRQYAMARDLKAGDRIQVDNGFTCAKPTDKITVKRDKDGDLYFPCRCGKHFLAGQVGDHGELIGVYKIS